jgi:hypothetical protein
VGNPNGGGNSDIQNYACIACNWGPVPDDYSQVFTLNHVYELPFGPGRKYLANHWAGRIVGGWNLNGIWTARSGGRFTPVLGTNVSNSTGGGTQRPNRIASGYLSQGQSIYDWFNTSAFVAPAQYTFGNSGTGILTGPADFNLDLSLVRHIRITERYGLDLRGEAFNSLNHVNFANPNASIGTASAGIISSAANARIIQVSAKFVF